MSDHHHPLLRSQWARDVGSGGRRKWQACGQWRKTQVAKASDGERSVPQVASCTNAMNKLVKWWSVCLHAKRALVAMLTAVLVT